MCGPERVLVHEVSQAYGPAEHWHAGSDPEPDIWAACLQDVPGPSRTVVVHSAENLTDMSQMALAAGVLREMPSLRLIFVSSLPSDRDGKKVYPGAAIAAGSPLGQVVRCAVAPEGRQNLLSALLGGDKHAAARLDTVTGGSLYWSLAAVSKLRGAGLPLTSANVSLVADAHIAGEYSDRLLLGDRKGALALALALERQERLGFALAGCAASLDTLASLYHTGDLNARDAVKASGVPSFLVLKFRPAAKHYPPAEVGRRRVILAEADHAYLRGARTGVAEYVAALW